MKTLLKSSVFPLAILTHVLIRVYFTSDFLNDPELQSTIPSESTFVSQVNAVDELPSEESLAVVLREEI